MCLAKGHVHTSGPRQGLYAPNSRSPATWARLFQAPWQPAVPEWHTSSTLGRCSCRTFSPAIHSRSSPNARWKRSASRRAVAAGEQTTSLSSALREAGGVKLCSRTNGFSDKYGRRARHVKTVEIGACRIWLDGIYCPQLAYAVNMYRYTVRVLVLFYRRNSGAHVCPRTKSFW